MTARLPATCAIDADVPGCDSGPGGRLSFVLREALAAWRTRRARIPARPTTRTPADDRLDAHDAADGRPDLPLGGTR